MVCNSLLGTGPVWDNIGRFVATITGTDTLHGTFGIPYQTRFKDDIDITNEWIIGNITIE